MSENLRQSLANMNMYDDRSDPSGPESSGYSSQTRSSNQESNSLGSSENQRITLEKTTNIQKKDLPYQAQTFVERPGTILGSKLGEKIIVTTNFVQLKMNEQPILLHQYDIGVYVKDKLITKREKSGPLFWECVKQNSGVFPTNLSRMLFNDVNMLWSMEQLKVELGDVELPIRNGVMVRIKYSSIMEFSQNAKLASDRDLTVTVVDAVVSQRTRCPLEPGQADCFTACNNGIFSQFFKIDGMQLTIALGAGMEAWTGVHFAAKLNLQGGPMANIDLSHSVFHTPGYNLVRLIMDVISNHKVSDEEYERMANYLRYNCMTDANRKELGKLLKNKTLQITYGKRRSFKFTELTTTPASQYMFYEGGRRISVAEHFYNKNQALRFPELPCVVGPVFKGCVDASVFPMEFVTTAERVQKYKGRIPESQLAPMIRGTAYRPSDRFDAIQNLALEGRRNENGQEVVPPLIKNDGWMQNFDLKVGRDFFNAEGTIIPPPTLIYGNAKYHDREHHGVWEAVNSYDGFKTVLSAKCAKTQKIKKIIPSIITIQNPNLPYRNNLDINHSKFQLLMEVVEQFGQPVLRDAGNRGSPYCYYTGTHHQRENSINDLRSKLLKIKQHIENDAELAADGTQPVPLIIFIFANRCTTMKTRKVDIISDYGVIKQLCDGELGLNCQGILQKTFNQIDGELRRCSTAHNMAFKILAKIGTVHYMLERNGKHKNWTIFTDPEDATLVIGIDVTHPGDLDTKKGGISACSVAAVVANVDTQMTRYGESVRIQQRGEERIVRMEEAINERIVEFQKNTGVKPKHIVCYRDGVSETEFKRVLYEEKLTITRACEMLEKGYQPTLTYIVVSKRHHTRFCATRQEDTQGNVYNMKPGCLVETGVTTNNFFDFYLISQFGPLGTSRPTHYYVLYDDWKPSKAFWQTITYALTYAYVRTTKSISIPAPVMYAHLCAKRAKDRLQAIDEIKRQDNEPFNLNQFEEYSRVTQQMKPHQDLYGILYC